MSNDEFKTVQSDLRQIDIYRDTPIRYLGYANEIGEAFRSLLPLVAVRATYVVSLGYACADALDKSSRVFKRYKGNPEKRRSKVSVAAVDTFIWQSLASVAIPGFTINRVCHFSGSLMNSIIIVELVHIMLECDLILAQLLLCLVRIVLLGDFCIRVSRWPVPVRKWVVTAIGLCTIPIIIHPIDAAVEIGMNETLRQLYNYERF